MSRKIALGTALAVPIAVGLFLLVIVLRWDRTFEAPLPALAASSDSSVIARGRYLAYGPARCADCHVAPADTGALRAGAEPPLAGGQAFVIASGTFYAPNLTPDAAAGIGGRSDGELARLLRFGVRHDGRAALPFMTAQDASDEDLVALMSFLRAQPPVPHEVPAHRPNLIGKAVLAFMVTPAGPHSTPPATTPAAVGPERGAYLANGFAACVGCHTGRGLSTGAHTGPRFAGGTPRPVRGDPTRELVPPNLTPDSATGRIASWTEDAFVARFRAGKTIPESDMPWEAYARSSDDDLRSIYRYLMSLPPEHHDTGPSVRPKS